MMVASEDVHSKGEMVHGAIGEFVADTMSPERERAMMVSDPESGNGVKRGTKVLRFRVDLGETSSRDTILRSPVVVMKVFYWIEGGASSSERVL